jgi:hypothetical protein
VACWVQCVVHMLGFRVQCVVHMLGFRVAGVFGLCLQGINSIGLQFMRFSSCFSGAQRSLCVLFACYREAELYRMCCTAACFSPSTLLPSGCTM